MTDWTWCREQAGREGRQAGRDSESLVRGGKGWEREEEEATLWRWEDGRSSRERRAGVETGEEQGAGRGEDSGGLGTLEEQGAGRVLETGKRKALEGVDLLQHLVRQVQEKGAKGRQEGLGWKEQHKVVDDNQLGPENNDGQEEEGREEEGSGGDYSDYCLPPDDIAEHA